MPTSAEYLKQLKSLMPRGRVWSWTGLLNALFVAFSDEFAIADVRAAKALLETDPRTVDETLDWWETKYGLPGTGTESERIAALVSRVISKQRTRPIDYQEKFASVLGYADPSDLEIVEISRAKALEMEDDTAIYRFYLHRNPLDPGSYSVEDAQLLLDSFVQSHTRGKVIESRRFRCDNQYSLCDRDLLGPVANTTSLVFNGSDTAIDFGQPAALDAIDVDQTFAISLWVRSTDTAVNYLWSRNSDPTDGAFGFQLRDDGIFQIYFEDTGSGADYRIETTSDIWNDGDWHHVVFNKTGTAVEEESFEIWVDGVSQTLNESDSGTITNAFGSVSTILGARKSLLGQASHLDGDMRGVAAFAASLGSVDIAALYNEGDYADPDGVHTDVPAVFVARLNDSGETTQIVDEIGGAIGTVIGTLAYTDS